MKDDIFKARINDLIALAHILDEFEGFSSAIKKVITELNIRPRQLGSYILKVSKNQFVLSRKIKKFYMDNESTIKTIMQYSSIVEFICFNYNNSGEIFSFFDDFYQHMVENRDKFDQMLVLLEHLNRLGFKNIQFNPNLGESQEEYTISRHYHDNICEIVYSDGIQILPTAILGDIKYKIVGGNYVMKLLPGMPSLSKDWMQSSDPIVVKNLLFDVKCLPESLSKEATFDRIRKLSEVQKEKSDKIRQSVHLSVLTDNFFDQYEYGFQIADEIDVATKEELIEILNQIKIQLDKMQRVSSEYDEALTQTDTAITKEQLQTEKASYVKRYK